MKRRPTKRLLGIDGDTPVGYACAMYRDSASQTTRVGKQYMAECAADVVPSILFVLKRQVP